jgi:hypothetical protein
VAGGADPLRTECTEYASEINHGAHNAGAKCLERALIELTEGEVFLNQCGYQFRVIFRLLRTLRRARDLPVDKQGIETFGTEHLKAVECDDGHDAYSQLMMVAWRLHRPFHSASDPLFSISGLEATPPGLAPVSALRGWAVWARQHELRLSSRASWQVTERGRSMTKIKALEGGAASCPQPLPSEVSRSVTAPGLPLTQSTRSRASSLAESLVSPPALPESSL